MDPWDEIAKKLQESVKARVGTFVDDHEEVGKFLAERTERLGRLTWELTRHRKNEEQYAKIVKHMEIVDQTIDNDVAALQIDAADELKEGFRDALKDVVGFVRGLLPEIIKLVP